MSVFLLACFALQLEALSGEDVFDLISMNNRTRLVLQSDRVVQGSRFRQLDSMPLYWSLAQDQHTIVIGSHSKASVYRVSDFKLVQSLECSMAGFVGDSLWAWNVKATAGSSGLHIVQKKLPSEERPLCMSPEGLLVSVKGMNTSLDSTLVFRDRKGLVKSMVLQNIDEEVFDRGGSVCYGADARGFVKLCLSATPWQVGHVWVDGRKIEVGGTMLIHTWKARDRIGALWLQVGEQSEAVYETRDIVNADHKSEIRSEIRRVWEDEQGVIAYSVQGNKGELARTTWGLLVPGSLLTRTQFGR